MTWAAIAVGLAFLGALVFVAVRWGASRESDKQSKATAKQKDRQIEAAIDRPRTRSELTDRLRDKGL